MAPLALCLCAALAALTWVHSARLLPSTLSFWPGLEGNSVSSASCFASLNQAAILNEIFDAVAFCSEPSAVCNEVQQGFGKP